MLTSPAIKRLGVLLIAVGAPLVHYVVPGAFWLRTSAAIAAGLMMIFFSKERIDDERVRELKLKAIHAAFSVSFTLTLIVNWVLNRDFDVRRDFDSTAGAWRLISGFDLIILTLTVALVVFYYWRFQDNSEASANIEPRSRGTV